MNVRPWDPNVWFSPCHIINTLGEAVLNKRNLKKHKEAWCAAVTTICHRELHPEDHEWWIQVPKNDPPDVLAMQLVPREDGKGNSISLIHIEVFEIRDFKEETLEEAIRRKLHNKDYSQTILIGFVRKIGMFDHVLLAESIQKLKPRIHALGLIVFEEVKSTNVSFIQLFPVLSKFTTDFGSHCKNTKQRSFIELSRSTKPKKDEYITTDKLTIIP